MLPSQRGNKTATSIIVSQRVAIAIGMTLVSEMHAWHVGKVRRFNEPVDAGTKTMNGYPTPRTLDVTVRSVSEGP